MFARLCVCGIAAVLLGGCGSVEIRANPDAWLSFEGHAYVPPLLQQQLAEAPACCASLASLPYRDIESEGIVTARIGTESPAFPFDTGKSFLAAFRLASPARPLRIQVVSRRTAESGSIGKLLPDFRQLVFAPTVLILDEKFSVRRTIVAGEPLTGCATNSFEDVYRMPVDIDEPPEQSRYVVVLTTDAQRLRDGERICGLVRHGLSPIGDVSLRVSGLDYSDGTILLGLPSKWYPGTSRSRDLGLFAGILTEPGLLLLGETAVHFLEERHFHYGESLRIPYERIVSAKSDDPPGRPARHVTLGVLDPSKNGLLHHTFESWPPPGEAVVPASDVVARLASRIRPDRFVERIGFSVADRDPTIEFVVQDAGATRHIAETALAGGMITAFPCALCQTGACTPDVLLSCAALFSVGAVVGGIVGGGNELIARIVGDSPPVPSIPTEQARSIEPVVAAARDRHFDRSALLGCISKELTETSGAAWHDQGRKALLYGVAPTDRQTPPEHEFGAESLVTRIALVPDQHASGSLSDLPVHLRIDGELRFTGASGQTPLTSPVSWESAPHRLQEWVDSGPRLVGDALQQGCRELSRQIVESTRHAWMEQ